MNKKVLIMLVILMVLIALSVFAIYIYTATQSNTENNNQVSKTNVEAIKPTLELSKNLNKNKNIVEVNIKFQTTDEQGIKELILPDGSNFVSSEGETTYKITTNGKYEFKVIGKNEAEVTKVIEVTELPEVSSTTPYVPEGFSVIESNVDLGFTIEDELGNQYVWVPVESGKVKRNTDNKSEYEDSDPTALELVNSVGKYYGFYIAKYEASKYEIEDDVVVASMQGKMPWSNVDYLTAVEAIEKSVEKFEYEDVMLAISNSYSWDTTLDWIDQTTKKYSSSTNYGNFTETILPTGATDKDILNNIADLSGNLREWTTEIYTVAKENKNAKNGEQIRNRMIRGGSASLSRSASAHTDYPENTSDNYWGFRMILYKK